MCAQHHDEKPNMIVSIFKNNCPRCRRGYMYQHKGAFRIKGLMAMHHNCPTCGQTFDMEPGFYYGTNMISYALAVIVSIISFIVWLLLVGISLKDARFFWWLGVNAILLVFLQPWLMRFSRTVWLYIFVKYSPNWKEGDVVEAFNVNNDQSNNW
jgi:hypothetical protein